MSELPQSLAHLQEHTLDSQELLRGNFLHAFRDRIRLPDGREASREYVRHPGAVVVVAELPDGRLVVERQCCSCRRTGGGSRTAWGILQARSGGAES
jgi:ADP-ribose pyrophosphatase